MKKYTELTQEEIRNIVVHGGDEREKLNRAVADHLDGLKLSEKARDIIDGTDSNIYAECFGGMFAAGDVEEYVALYFPDN